MATAVVCSNCQAENAAEARFCNQCGAPLDAVAAGSERRQITVFFSDLSGFTSLSEHLDPEEVRSIMNRIFGWAREIVERYGGRIDKLLGDAVMAVFGDPTVHEDDAERAVRAVLELHEAVAGLSDEVAARVGRPISMHTGINTGLVVTGGAEFDNAIGDSINVAARLEDLSEPGEILLGPETAQLVAGVFDLADHGLHDLKGKSGPVQVMKVAGLAAVRTERARPGGTFVGRHEELGVLLGGVERMRDGESTVVTISADAGVGKTRLLSEFRHRLPDEVQWLEGRAYAYGENIPYAPVIDLVRRATGINEDDAAAVAEARLREAVADLTDDPERNYPPLARLFGLSVPDDAALDRETYRQRLAETLGLMLDRLAGRAPTVLAFQDLHWADPSSVRLVKGLIDRLEAPVFVVANFRPQFSLSVPGERALTLGDLSPRQAEELLASLLDGQAPAPELVEFIVARTDGNPFFIEEIVNSLTETGALQEDADGRLTTADPGGLDLPTSIRGVIAARIDRLDDRRRRVLREASVVGREFLFDVVRRVTSVTDELAPSLDALQDADLIIEKVPVPDLEYIFKHALTQEVAYDGLLLSEREQLHARAASAIETLFAGRLEEVVETLAYHWTHSGVTDKAVAYLIAAGRKAMERFSLDESRAHFRHAYDTLRSEPESEARDRGLVEVLLEWAFLAYYQARLHDLRRLLLRHQDAVDRVGTVEQQGMWTAWLGHAYLAADGDFPKAVELLDRALEIGRAHDNARVVAYAQAWRVYGLWWLGRMAEAEEAGREASLGLTLPAEPYPWFKGRCGLGMSLSAMGEFAEARDIGNELVEFGRRHGSARATAMGHLVLSNVAAMVYDEPGNAEHSEAIIEAAPDPIYDHSPLISRLIVLMAEDRFAEAREMLDDHDERYVVGLHVRMMRGWMAIIDAVLQIAEGNIVDGFARLEEEERSSAESGNGIYEAYAQMMLATAYAQVARADPTLGEKLRNLRFAGRAMRAGREARTRLDAALKRIDELGLGGWRFGAEWSYALFLAHEGDTEGAVDHLRSAIATAEPAGDGAGLRRAREMLEVLTA